MSNTNETLPVSSENESMFSDSLNTFPIQEPLDASSTVLEQPYTQNTQETESTEPLVERELTEEEREALNNTSFGSKSYLH